MSDFQKLLGMLADAGVTDFVNRLAMHHSLVAVVRPQDAECLGRLLPDVALHRLEANRQPHPHGTDMVVDCRPPAPMTIAGLLVEERVPTLLLDAVAGFLTQATSLQPARPVGQRYYLLSTPRSGSTFFCDLLTRTNVLGRPTEHLKPWLRHYLVAARISLPALIERLHAHSATANGIFGSKIIINDLFEFLADFPDEMFAELSGYPILFLVRGDKAAQALSNARSNQLAVYHVDNSSEAEARRRLSTFKADYRQVFATERWLLRQEADLLGLLRSKGLRPHLVSYETCIQSRQGAAAVIQDIAALMNVRAPQSLSWPESLKIGDLSSDNALAHYQALRRGMHLFSTRSEPWLGLILGSGWKNPERWGVRSGSLDLTLAIPPRVHPGAVEMLIVFERQTCSTELTIGATTLRPSCPETGSSTWRGLMRLDKTDAPTIQIRLSDGAIGLEEVVLYDTVPDWYSNSLERNPATLTLAEDI